MKRLLPLPVVIFLGGLTVAATAAEVRLTPLTDRVRVEVDGALFTEYIFRDGATRTYLYPILAPDGRPVTRDFPMKDTPGEEQDHPWHRSLWFAHSMVNGVDFWNEGTGGARSPKEKGRTVQEGPVETTSGPTGIIRTRNRWLGADGRLICTDNRKVSFHATAAGRFIDYEVTLHALPDARLLMGDNKDGTMAIRLAQWMTLPHKYQKKDVPGNGRILTSTGVRDAAAWGTRAAWCDYYVPYEGTIYGVAIFDHPQNLRHPTWWMARDYGLFGANPFGQHDYEGLTDQPHIGDHTIPAGGSLTLRYRFYIHLGDTAAARVAEAYADYAAGK